MTDPAALPYRPCVGVVLANRGGLIFAGERFDMPGAWQMPQGGIDAGETPAEAALRELAEETGLSPDHVRIEAEHPDWLTYDLPPELMGKVWKGRYRGQRQRWFLARLTGPEAGIDIATEHPEFARWKWAVPEEILASIVPFKRAIYARVLGEFSKHL